MGLNRRSFLKFVAGAGAGIMVTPVPWKLLDDASIWTQNWPWIPRNQHGENAFMHVMSKMCPSSAALKVRLVGGRPVRVLPDPAHPLGGGMTAINAAEIQMLHSPARVREPQERGPDGGYRTISWEDAAQKLFAKLQEAKDKTAFLSGDETGTTNEIISAFAKAIDSDDVFLMPSEGQAAAVAAAAMGIPGQIGYDLEQSDFILALGANLLETWGPVVRNRRVFFKNRPYAGQKSIASVELAYASPVQDNTAVAAKYWLPIRPGTEGILALGLAAELIKAGRIINTPDFAIFKNLCMTYSLEKTASITGVSASLIQEVAAALRAAKAPVVIAGSSGVGGTGAAPVVAGMALNALLGNIGRRGGVTIIPDAPVAVSGAKTRREIFAKNFCSWLAGQKGTQVLVIHEANPAFALPNPDTIKKLLAAIPFKVAFASMMDETASLCDLVLPIRMGLERYDDITTPYGYGKGIYSVTQPISEGTEQGTASLRHVGDILLTVARNLGKDLGFGKSSEVYKNKVAVMRGNIDTLVAGTALEYEAFIPTAMNFSLAPGLLHDAFASVETKGLYLAVGTRLSMGTATTGIPPFNTKTLRDTELFGTEMFVSMNAGTAKNLSLKEHDRVKLKTNAGELVALLHITDAVRPDTVAVSFGFGHTALDGFSKNKGANVMDILEASVEPKTGLAVWSKTAVTVAKA